METKNVNYDTVRIPRVEYENLLKIKENSLRQNKIFDEFTMAGSEEDDFETCEKAQLTDLK